MQSTKKSRQQKMAKRDEAIPISIEDNPIQSHGPLLHTPADSTENDARKKTYQKISKPISSQLMFHLDFH